MSQHLPTKSLSTRSIKSSYVLSISQFRARFRAYAGFIGTTNLLGLLTATCSYTPRSLYIDAPFGISWWCSWTHALTIPSPPEECALGKIWDLHPCTTQKLNVVAQCGEGQGPKVSSVQFHFDTFALDIENEDGRVPSPFGQLMQNFCHQQK